VLPAPSPYLVNTEAGQKKRFQKSVLKQRRHLGEWRILTEGNQMVTGASVECFFVMNLVFAHPGGPGDVK